jgi:DNA repair protein RAD5
MTCDDGDWESPDQAVLFAAEIAAVRAVLGARLPATDVLAALARCGGNAERAINALLDSVADPSDDGDAERAIDALLDAEKARVKAERDVAAATPSPAPTPTVKVKAEPVRDAKMERPDGSPHAKGAPLPPPPPRRVKDEDEDEVTSRRRPRAGDCGISLVPRAPRAAVDDDDEVQIIDAPAAPPRSKKRAWEEDAVDLTATHPLPYLNPRPIRAIPPQEVAQMYQPPPLPAPAPRRARAAAAPPSSEWKMVVAPPEAEFGEFPPESDWFLVEKAYVNGLSTNSGRRAVDAGEIVHFAFPSYGRLHGGVKVSAKKAAALAQIVRFSTKRSGEVNYCAELSDDCWD